MFSRDRMSRGVRRVAVRRSDDAVGVLPATGVPCSVVASAWLAVFVGRLLVDMGMALSCRRLDSSTEGLLERCAFECAARASGRIWVGR